MLQPQLFTGKYSRAAIVHKIRQAHNIFKKKKAFEYGRVIGLCSGGLPDWSTVILCESKFSSLEIPCACGTLRNM
jgi:hypothetical protein